MNGPPDPWLYPLRFGCSLAAQDWIELHFHRLLSSRFLTHAVAEGRRGDLATAMILWCESCRQDPAGTLPDDDVQLAQMAKFGTDLDGWMAVREGALYGWGPVEIPDAEPEDERRLGHRFIARLVKHSYERKAGKQAGREAARLANLKNRVKVKLIAAGQKRLADQDDPVRRIALWLDQNQLFVTAENVASAVDVVLGVRRVVPLRGADGEE